MHTCRGQCITPRGQKDLDQIAGQVHVLDVFMTKCACLISGVSLSEQCSSLVPMLSVGSERESLVSTVCANFPGILANQKLSCYIVVSKRVLTATSSAHFLSLDGSLLFVLLCPQCPPASRYF